LGTLFYLKGGLTPMISKPCSFTFNDVSSEDFGDGLVIYYLGDPGGSYTEPLYTVDLFETRLTTRHDSIYHGLTDNNNTLTRELVFGSTDGYLDKETIDAVAQWLSSVNGYSRLVIDNDELGDYFFWALFQTIELVSNGDAYAFRCDVCFSDQFAHEEPYETTFNIADDLIQTATGEPREQTVLNNDSSLYDYHYPLVTLHIPLTCDEFSIVNMTDKNGTRPFLFKNITSLSVNDDSNTLIVEIDNLNKIIKSPNCDNIKALYRCFGNIDEHYHYFFRLLPGDNTLIFTGTGMVKIQMKPVRKVGF